MATDLQLLINAIPVAEEGHVISQDYHNLMRKALAAIVDQLSSTTTGAAVTASYPPHFTQNGSTPNWRVTNGIAVRDPTGSSDGWFALNLPQGSRIQSMTVKGRRVAAVLSFTVKLLRVVIGDPDGENVSVINISLKTAPDPFTAMQIPTAPGGLGPTALEELRRVDNTTYTYLVTATVSGSAGTDLIQINGIQIVYTLP